MGGICYISGFIDSGTVCYKLEICLEGGHDESLITDYMFRLHIFKFLIYNSSLLVGRYLITFQALIKAIQTELVTACVEGDDHAGLLRAVCREAVKAVQLVSS